MLKVYCRYCGANCTPPPSLRERRACVCVLATLQFNYTLWQSPYLFNWVLFYLDIGGGLLEYKTIRSMCPMFCNCAAHLLSSCPLNLWCCGSRLVSCNGGERVEVEMSECWCSWWWWWWWWGSDRHILSCITTCWSALIYQTYCNGDLPINWECMYGMTIIEFSFLHRVRV